MHRKRARSDDSASLQHFCEHRHFLRAQENKHIASVAADSISQNHVTATSPRRGNAVPAARLAMTPTGSDTEEYPRGMPAVPVQDQGLMDLDDDMADHPRFSQGSLDPPFSNLVTPLDCHMLPGAHTSQHSCGDVKREAASHPLCDPQLPSPASEGEASPSMQLSGVADIRMETEDKGQHTNAKPSALKDSGSPSTGRLEGAATKVSVGYRSDCAKCQLKVPGHYMHIFS